MGRRKSLASLAGSGPMDIAEAAGGAPTRVEARSCARRPDNPRPSQPDVEELASSIREVGQVQPAVVASRSAYLAERPIHTNEIGDAEWVILAGNRRHAACLAAGVDELLVHVADERVSDIIELGIVENIQREPLTPLREAHELNLLHERYGTTRAVADRIGKSHVYVSQRISLLSLVPQLQTAVDDRTLNIEDARALARLPQTKQLDAYRAGPPYETTGPRRTKPADGVVPGESATYVRTEVGNAVSNDSACAGSGVSRRPVGNGVSNGSPSTAAAGSSANTSDDTGLPAPVDLADRIRSEYTEEQRQQLARLLLEVN